MRKINYFFIWAIIIIGIFGFTETKSILKTAQPVVGTAVGNKAPELNFRSPRGKKISLYSIKGKMVLIDFWASWCGPCRMENPNVVKAYNYFKDKKFQNGNGFIVYSVSLDKDQAEWEKAIDKDKLDWKYHVSDLKYWDSEPAAIYNIKNIPANFLIDKDGIILAKNLRGSQLNEALNSYLAK